MINAFKSIFPFSNNSCKLDFFSSVFYVYETLFKACKRSVIALFKIMARCSFSLFKTYAANLETYMNSSLSWLGLYRVNPLIQLNDLMFGWRVSIRLPILTWISSPWPSFHRSSIMDETSRKLGFWVVVWMLSAGKSINENF